MRRAFGRGFIEARKSRWFQWRCTSESAINVKVSLQYVKPEALKLQINPIDNTATPDVGRNRPKSDSVRLLHEIINLHEQMEKMSETESILHLQTISIKIKELDRISVEWAYKDIRYCCSHLRHIRNSNSPIVAEYLTAMTSKLNMVKKIDGSIKHNSPLYGLRYLTSSSEPVIRFVEAMCELMTRYPATHQHTHEISTALYGLQNMKADNVPVQNILTVLSQRITSSNTIWNGQNFSNALFGFQKMTGLEPGCSLVLEALHTKLQASGAIFYPSEFGLALHGIRWMSADLLIVRNLIVSLISRMNSISSCNKSIPVEYVSMMLHSLHEKSTFHQEIRQLLSAISARVPFCSGSFTVQQISGICYGLRRTSSYVREVRELLLVLKPLVGNSPAVMDAQAISNCMYGFQGMNSEHEEVRQFLVVVTEKIGSTSVLLNGLALGNASYGMRGLHSGVAEVDLLLKSFSSVVSRSVSSVVCSSQDISSAVFGLQSMSTDNAHVRQLLHNFEVLLRNCRGDLEEGHLGALLCGLKSMSSDCSVVRSFLSAVNDKIASSPEIRLSPRTLGVCLYGLQNMHDDAPEVQILLSFLTKAAAASSSDPLPPKDSGRALFGLKCMRGVDETVNQLLAALTPRIAASSTLFTPDDYCASICGLQNLSSDSQQVRELISMLSAKLSATNYAFSANNISTLMSGLKRMNDKHEEVRTFLTVFITKINLPSVKVETATIGNGLYGLRSLKQNSPEKNQLIGILASKLLESPGNLHALQFFRALRGLRGSDLGRVEVQSMIKVLFDKVSCETLAELDEPKLNILREFLRINDLGNEHIDVQRILPFLLPNLELSNGDSKTL